VKEPAEPRKERRRKPAVSLDEVLDAHEFLKTYEGSVADMLESGGQKAERDTKA
jgi:hypothetical protein